MYDRKQYIKVILTACVAILLLHPGRFSCVHYRIIDDSEILASLKSDLIPLGGEKLCPPLDMEKLAEFKPWKNVVQSEIELAETTNITNGGWWKPSNCKSLYNVLIVIPYRDRLKHLRKFSLYIHPFLQNQNISHRIVVVEQSHKRPFNRGLLFNIGYLESIANGDDFSCVILHDVDLLPLDGRNVYACVEEPRHMSANLDKFRFNLPYDDAFGGVVSIPAHIFEKVNGFSNRFFGWGGEDDDFKINRLRSDYPIVRFSPEVSRYTMLSHKQAVPSKDRFEKLQYSNDNLESDGLNSAVYSVIRIDFHPLYTKFLVDVQ